MDASAHDRLIRAERRGLRLAILARTLAVAAALAWLLAGSLSSGPGYGRAGLAALAAFTAVGVAHLAVIGTRFDRAWMKYAVYAADILGVCALFALIPVSSGGDVPQVLAFRAYGIYYLFPLIAMATLSLSPGLVLWAGAVAVVGWWTAFIATTAGIEQPLSWGDMPAGAAREAYETIFLSIDFVGTGNRVEETGFLLVAAAVLALAVHRARRVFLAQVAAEADRERERAARERIALTLGRYVPEAIAQRLIEDEAALAPQERHGVVLVMDVAGFTAFSAGRRPAAVIEALNRFLGRAADVIGDHDGVVISFTGDGLLATFGIPLEIEAPERAALAAAEALQPVAAEAGFSIRTGLAAGSVAAGSVGSSGRQAFTVYGDTVNRAARLEALGKELGAAVVTDEAVARAGADVGALSPAGRHDLKGLPDPVAVWTRGRAPG